MKQKKKILSHDMEINKLKTKNEILHFLDENRVDLNTIKKYFENIEQKGKNAFSPFIYMNKKYLDLYNYIIGDNNEIMIIAKKIIGKKLILKDEINDFFLLLKLLDSKICENNIAKIYYESFKNVLIGPKWNNSYTPEKIKKLDIFSNNKNNIIKHRSIFPENTFL